LLNSSSELFSRLYFAIEDIFGDIIDKEIEHAFFSNSSIKISKQHQTNKIKLENEGASIISRTISETRDFAVFRADILRQLQSTLIDLVDHFDEEFSVNVQSSASFPAPNLVADIIPATHQSIVGTSYELTDWVDYQPLQPRGGESSTYNVSYASDSETSITNGSNGCHVCRRRHLNDKC
jgi:hypothetical protein